jgi:hypothetical protein
MTEQKQPLTEYEMEVVVAAMGLEEGNSYVPKAEYIPAAEAMRAKGWLVSCQLDNGDTAYALSPAGPEAFKQYNAMQGYAAGTN